jgi:RNA polymerase sigma-70 factor (ECF subfamily)
MNASATLAMRAPPSDHRATVWREREIDLDSTRELDRFLASVERRAFRLAEIALRDTEDALDVVQDAMMQLASRYGARPAEEWRPLFYRILNNRIHDFQRRRRVRNRVLAWLPGRREDLPEETDPLDNLPDTGPLPLEELQEREALEALELALAALPARQQQAFMLRMFEGLDVAETAIAMGCSEGSVKTHHFRAVHALRAALQDHWT